MEMKELRKAMLFTQKEMAEVLDINKAYYNQIEGKKRIPGLSLKRKINEVFNEKIY